MPNEVDVELFRSLSPNNICLMQLHGSGLLKRLKILLSLYKSHFIALSTTYYQGHCSTSLLLCEKLSPQSAAKSALWQITHQYVCAIWKEMYLACKIAKILSVHCSLTNTWNLNCVDKLILIITPNDLPNRRPTTTINQSRTRDSLWNRKGKNQGLGGGLFESVLDMKTVLCFVPACGSF